MDFTGARAEDENPVRRLSAKASTVMEGDPWESEGSGRGDSRGLPRLETELTRSQRAEPEGKGKKEAGSQSGFQLRFCGEGRWTFMEMSESGAGVPLRHPQTSLQDAGQAGADAGLELGAVE